ncbi:hypothetical protein Sme01_27180 [Sphaerisporangium melleum]|uniref:Uncharacterized protein n=1 Tax=Sphaerisporangium melleum TaxID=321316 RepID=A0A917QW32_9ACTN|nr:hypothetical protein [Sphaerisporangium melleum]GGK70971.1 hypothetical protein GCM10007964_12160 [Sphaerisporangium melleum]GII70242.1 hypothetical protein Sme01_27180 [Sphaerisporangium melleum]
MHDFPNDAADHAALISAPAGQQMSDEIIDSTLRRIAEAVQQLIVQQEQAEHHYEMLLEEGERRITQRAASRDDSPGAWRERLIVDPLGSLLSERERLAAQAAKASRESMMEFAAWWADVAAGALISALLGGRRLTVGRVVMTDPHGFMDQSEVEQVAPLDDGLRQLIEMAVWMDDGLPAGAHGGAPRAVGGFELAERFGMIVRRRDDGNLVLIADGFPAARRRRLWGENWIQHRIPDLPPTFILQQALTRVAAPQEAATAIFDACFALDFTMAAAHHRGVLESELHVADAAGDNERGSRLDEAINRIIDIEFELPHALTAYAQALTDHLPAVRMAVQGSTTSSRGSDS